MSDFLGSKRILISSLSYKIWIAYHAAAVPSTLVGCLTNSPDWEGFLLGTMRYWTFYFYVVALNTQPSEKNIIEAFVFYSERPNSFCTGTWKFRVHLSMFQPLTHLPHSTGQTCSPLYCELPSRNLTQRAESFWVLSHAPYQPGITKSPKLRLAEA